MPRYDVYLQVVPADQYKGMAFLSFGQKRSVAVKGIQKLVDMFTMALLTPLGSDPLDLTRGTEIPNLIGSNITEEDAHDIVLLGVEKASQDLTTYQTGKTVPDDERFAAATLTDFIVLTDTTGFAAQIYIENVIQQGLTFLLPTLQVRT